MRTKEPLPKAQRDHAFERECMRGVSLLRGVQNDLEEHEHQALMKTIPDAKIKPRSPKEDTLVKVLPALARRRTCPDAHVHAVAAARLASTQPLRACVLMIPRSRALALRRSRTLG